MRCLLPMAACAVLVGAGVAVRASRPEAAPGVDPGEEVARVGDRALTAADVELLLAGDDPCCRRIPVAGLPAEAHAHHRREAVRSWVFEELLRQQAVRTGLDRTDPVVRRRLANVVYENEVMGPVMSRDVGDEELLAYYREHPDAFRRPTEIRGYRVELGFPAEMSETERAGRTAEVAGAMERGEEALDLALRRCEADGIRVRVPAALDRSETRQDLLRSDGAEVADAYLSEESGQRVVVVRTGDAVHVMRARRRSKARLCLFEEVRAEVREELLRAECQARYHALVRSLAGQVGARLPLGFWEGLGEKRTPAGE